MKCEKCNKEMTDETGNSMVGIILKLEIKQSAKLTNEQIIFYEKQMGKYELNKEYCFCWECYIDSLMRK